MDGQKSRQNTADMSAVVQDLIVQMQNRFQGMSENIVSKIDEMGNRIDELEESINNLKTEVLTDNTSTYSNPEEPKPTHN